jgi:PPM family protein phosphatase
VLRIADWAERTDVGRQRNTNEDALVAAPPFFAVADGMGGAKAGEVASHIATQAFDAEHDRDMPPERRLAEIARAANRRIYELAGRDDSLRGMGTTLTAAIVSGGEVSLGHVGDSRAYRLRGGALEQLTKDHSLVAELERTGQISPEAAEHHPQRSIITRALGPEPDVDVDTYTVPARDDDVFLLCSDGLTTMVPDDDVAAILRGAASLEEAADALVRAANQSGGKDNVTVVLFRLRDDGEPAPEPGGDDTIAGTARLGDVPAPASTVAERDTAEHALPAGADDSAAGPEAAPPRARRAPPRASGVCRRAAPRRRRAGLRRRRLRTALGALAGLAVLALMAGGLYLASRQVWFLGTNDAGLVTLYRGLPYELPLGVKLYEERYASGVPARAIPARRRGRVLDHEWRSRRDAEDLVRQLERGGLSWSAGSVALLAPRAPAGRPRGPVGGG